MKEWSNASTTVRPYNREQDGGNTVIKASQKKELERAVESEVCGMDEMRCIPCSEEPSEEEVARHRAMGHPHFRSWCPSCVRGRGKSGVHKKGRDEESKTITLCVDYMKMTRRKVGNKEDIRRPAENQQRSM